MSENTLTVTDDSTKARYPIPLASLFACFERSELTFFCFESASFTETSQFITRKWEMVDREWFSKVKGLIDRSIDAPKSLEKLFAVVDLYLRARAAGTWIDDRWWEVWGGTEEQQREILTAERRVGEFRRVRDLDWGELDPWELEERRAAKRDLPTPGTDAPARLADQAQPPAELPAVGSEIQLRKRLESFGGFVSPGPVTVVAAWVGESGMAFVSLGRGGRVIAQGVQWPMKV